MSTKKKGARIIWFEIPANDLGRAKKFYHSLFGWKIAPLDGMQGPEARNYLHVQTGGPDASPDGGIMPRKQPDQPVVNYVNVPSVARFVARVEKLGGTVCMGKTAVPRMGYFALCQDTEN
ncbi:MAG: VOC family protein, partial [Verrucomicrobia bacterium]|nr:VOC family protein [Verrucomicrobiota bacterium]